MPRIKSRPIPDACVLGLALLCLLPACKPKEMGALLEPSQVLGTVVAEEGARLAGAKKQVALITHDASWGPASTTEERLRETLKKQGVTVVVAKAANLGNPMFSGEVGLKAADFLEALGKSAGAGAIISLVGAPRLSDEDTARVSAAHPPVLVVATTSLGNKMGVRGDPVQLARLLESKIIQMAVIDGADSAPSATPAKPDPTRSLFGQHFRILRRPD